jgi:hypothetical protein
VSGIAFDLETPPIREAIARGQNIFLLFPGDDAIDLDNPTLAEQELLGHLRGAPPPTNSNNDSEEPLRQKNNLLILVDGTWTQARRLALNSPQLLEHCQQV